MADAASEGYSRVRSGVLAPYHGYYYRILTAQGKDAPGGQYGYLIKGRLIGGPSGRSIARRSPAP